MYAAASIRRRRGAEGGEATWVAGTVPSISYPGDRHAVKHAISEDEKLMTMMRGEIKVRYCSNFGSTNVAFMRRAHGVKAEVVSGVFSNEQCGLNL